MDAAKCVMDLVLLAGTINRGLAYIGNRGQYKSARNASHRDFLLAISFHYLCPYLWAMEHGTIWIGAGRRTCLGKISLRILKSTYLGT